MKKSSKITFFIIIAALVLAGVIIYSNNNNDQSNIVSAELAQCIGNNSIEYVQLGCPHCEDQEKLFGSNFKYIKSVDCFYNQQECINAGVEGTPTWIIDGTKYLGLQSIPKLQQLTGC